MELTNKARLEKLVHFFNKYGTQADLGITGTLFGGLEHNLFNLTETDLAHFASKPTLQAVRHFTDRSDTLGDFARDYMDQIDSIQLPFRDFQQLVKELTHSCDRYIKIPAGVDPALITFAEENPQIQVVGLDIKPDPLYQSSSIPSNFTFYQFDTRQSMILTLVAKEDFLFGDHTGGLTHIVLDIATRTKPKYVIVVPCCLNKFARSQYHGGQNTLEKYDVRISPESFSELNDSFDQRELQKQVTEHLVNVKEIHQRGRDAGNQRRACGHRVYQLLMQRLMAKYINLGRVMQLEQAGYSAHLVYHHGGKNQAHSTIIASTEGSLLPQLKERNSSKKI